MFCDALRIIDISVAGSFSGFLIVILLLLLVVLVLLLFLLLLLLLGLVTGIDGFLVFGNVVSTADLEYELEFCFAF